MRILICLLFIVFGTNLHAADGKFTFGFDISGWRDGSRAFTTGSSSPNMVILDGTEEIEWNSMRLKSYFGFKPIIRYELSNKVAVSTSLGVYSQASLLGAYAFDNESGWHDKDNIQIWIEPEIEYTFSIKFTGVILVKYRLRKNDDVVSIVHSNIYCEYWAIRYLNIQLGLESFFRRSDVSAPFSSKLSGKSGILFGSGFDIPLSSNINLVGNCRISTTARNSIMVDTGFRYHF